MAADRVLTAACLGSIPCQTLASGLPSKGVRHSEQSHHRRHRTGCCVLVGFVPQYLKVNNLRPNCGRHGKGTSAELRDLAASPLANQKNYGIAAGTAQRFFNRVREVANQAPDANAKKSYEDLLISCDKITAELAKGDAAVMGDLQDLFVKTRRATGISTEQ
jgi:hypothetical protein